MMTHFSIRPRMTSKTSVAIGARWSPWVRGLTIVALLASAACGGLLDVSDPTLVQDKDITNAAGANARRNDVWFAFYQGAGTAAADVAVFTDERIIDLPVTFSRAAYFLDRRDSQGFETLYATPYGNTDPHLGPLDNVVTKSSLAIPEIRLYTPDSLRGDFLSQLYGYRGYAILQMAEDVCPGFPIDEIVDNLPALSGPYTTDSAAKYAITQLDSAIANAQDSIQFRYFAQVVKGRALVDLGQYAQAAAIVSGVPTDFLSQSPPIAGAAPFFQQASTWNPNNKNNIRLAVGDTEGTNGLPFVAAHDQRVPTVYKVLRYTNTKDSLYDQLKYLSIFDPMTLASGIEARLIEAEAALNAGDPSWFATLNTLRATMISPAMAPIPTMPVTTADQIDLLYRERAFWMYLTGRRLGDLRRLIRNYGRNPETVFPTGPYSSRGGNYGTATSIPFIQRVQARTNPKITAGCTTR